MSDLGKFNFGQYNPANQTGGTPDFMNLAKLPPSITEFDINDPNLPQFLTAVPGSGSNPASGMQALNQIIASIFASSSATISKILSSSGSGSRGGGNGLPGPHEPPQSRNVAPPGNSGNPHNTGDPHKSGNIGNTHNEHVPGNVQTWVDEAARELAKRGIHMSERDKKNMAIIAMHESGGDPNAINLHDGNAAAGHPSIGLVQTIQPTFNAYKLPGHDNIRNPVDNIIAGYRYAIATYGSTDNVPGIKSLNQGREYVGY